MKAKVKRIDMAIHIQEICAKYNITVRYQTLKDKQPNYYARPATKEIHVRPTKILVTMKVPYMRLGISWEIIKMFNGEL